VHTTIEEEIFYPAAREALDEGDLVAEALVEHASAKELIAKLEGMDADSEDYDATFTVLGEYVNHHIEEEQGEMFPKMKKAGLDWDGLAQQMQQRKQALQEEMGLGGAEAEQTEEEEEAAKPASRRAGHEAPRTRRPASGK